MRVVTESVLLPPPEVKPTADIRLPLVQGEDHGNLFEKVQHSQDYSDIKNHIRWRGREEENQKENGLGDRGGLSHPRMKTGKPSVAPNCGESMDQKQRSDDKDEKLYLHNEIPPENEHADDGRGNGEVISKRVPFGACPTSHVITPGQEAVNRIGKKAECEERAEEWELPQPYRHNQDGENGDPPECDHSYKKIHALHFEDVRGIHIRPE